MYTEEQAKTKWCPHVRSAGATDNGEIVVANRDAKSMVKVGHAITLNPPSCRCIASECMAWRWDVTLNDQLLADARAEYADMPDPAPPLKDTDIWADFLKSRHGYCGLAGGGE